MNKKLLFAIFIASIVGHKVNAQGLALNADGSSADASAMLDIKSAAKGVLIPRMTQADRTSMAAPATGLLVYQTDGVSGFYYNSGTSASPSWTFIQNSSNSNVTLQGNTFNGADQLVQLDAMGKLPAVDGSALTNVSANATGNAGGDLAGTYPSPTIANNATTGGNLITSINSATSGTINTSRLQNTVTAQGNTFNGADQLVQLDATGKLPAVDGSALTNVSANATGSAGGDLSGAYPSPTIANNATTGGNLITSINSATSGTINAARLPATVTAQGNTFNGADQLVQLDATGKLPAVDGSALTNMSAAPSGSAGGDLSGTYPSPTIANNATTGGNLITSINSATSGTISTSRLQNTVTAQGNTFNGSNQLVKLDGTGKLPAVDGSALTNISASVSGTAGGDLTGTYPNPTIAVNGTVGARLISAINSSPTGSINVFRLPSVVTTMGNQFNGTNQLVQLNGTALPAVDGSALTNVPSPGMFVGACSNPNLMTTFYTPVSGLTSGGAAYLYAAMPVPYSCTIDALQVVNIPISGASTDLTVTLYKNGVATSLSCQLSTVTSGTTSCNDMNAGHAVSLSAGDTIAFRCDVDSYAPIFRICTAVRYK